MAFIDGDKREYIKYYKAILPKLKKGALIIADNVLWDNKIFSTIVSNDFMTQGIVEFNEYVRNDPNVEKLILDLRDGIMLLRKK
jgi:caffeoyl-CoA O-methyltransferase